MKEHWDLLWGINFLLKALTSDVDIVATYSNVLGLNGASPVGDLYLNLKIDFVNGTFVNNNLGFYTDTDNSLYAGDIIPSVPEPASMSLMFLGILSLAGFACRRSSKK